MSKPVFLTLEEFYEHLLTKFEYCDEGSCYVYEWKNLEKDHRSLLDSTEKWSAFALHRSFNTNDFSTYLMSKENQMFTVLVDDDVNFQKLSGYMSILKNNE